MKQYFFLAAAALLLTGFTSVAQNDDSLRKENSRLSEDRERSAKDKKMGDYDEIIIKRKSPDVNEKVTIEIKDNEIKVNGKPIEDFIDEAISVRTHSPNHYQLIAPPSPFRFPGSTWSLEKGNMYNGGGINRPFLGVSTEGSSEGTKIISVTENSAAAKAGLKKDDIITKINDKTVLDHKQLTEAISALKPEEKITITYKRNGKENKTTAVLGRISVVTKTLRRHSEDPEDPAAPFPPLPPIPQVELNFDDLGTMLNFNGKPRLGIKAQDTEEGKGVKVLGVDEGSAAEIAGIKENDLITSFDGKEVNSAPELAEASHASTDKSSVKIQLRRNGKTQDIELKIPKKLKTANL